MSMQKEQAYRMIFQKVVDNSQPNSLQQIWIFDFASSCSDILRKVVHKGWYYALKKFYMQ